MFITYKTTNKITGEYYIGSHKTDDLHDNYLGSGRILRESIAKYGVENHTREILGVFATRKESTDLERKLIKEKKESCINANWGGNSFDFINENELNNSNNNYIKAHSAHLYMMKNDNEYNKKVRNNISQGLNKSEKVKQRNMNMRGKPGTFKGKKHSEQTKSIMSQNRKGKYCGSSNSQYNTYWITNGVDSKKWSDKKGDLPEGYKKGRQIKFKNMEG